MWPLPMKKYCQAPMLGPAALLTDISDDGTSCKQQRVAPSPYTVSSACLTSGDSEKGSPSSATPPEPSSAAMLACGSSSAPSAGRGLPASTSADDMLCPLSASDCPSSGSGGPSGLIIPVVETLQAQMAKLNSTRNSSAAAAAAADGGSGAADNGKGAALLALGHDQTYVNGSLNLPAMARDIASVCSVSMAAAAASGSGPSPAHQLLDKAPSRTDKAAAAATTSGIKRATDDTPPSAIDLWVPRQLEALQAELLTTGMVWYFTSLL